MLHAIWLCGCKATNVASNPQAPGVAPVDPIQTGGTEIGRSAEGRPIECITYGAGPICVLFIASIHGSEPAGTPLLNRLARELPTHPDLLNGRTVLIVPNANPDGMAQRRRGNSRGVDLNRNFPSASWKHRFRHGPQPLSESESRALHELIIVKKPDRIISFHQPLACIDYDGPGAELAQAMSTAGHLPVNKLGAQPGSLGSFAGVDLGIPIITLELPGSASRMSEEQLWAAYGGMMITAIQHPHSESGPWSE